ncbi:hypothetical protein ABT255_58630 [Streptomyces mirabilis]|uniref:hypothetical protein n=1 Tax=Streptomyces mirabilis TaxID=68239 RepID=UPI000C1AEF46
MCALIPPDDRAPEEPNHSLGGPSAAEYSATELASHWVTGPEREEPATPTPGELAATVLDEAATTTPERVEGTVLRFGPGVTAATARRRHSRLAGIQQRHTCPSRNCWNSSPLTTASTEAAALHQSHCGDSDRTRLRSIFVMS